MDAPNQRRLADESLFWVGTGLFSVSKSKTSSYLRYGNSLDARIRLAGILWSPLRDLVPLYYLHFHRRNTFRLAKIPLETRHPDNGLRDRHNPPDLSSRITPRHSRAYLQIRRLRYLQIRP